MIPTLKHFEGAMVLLLSNPTIDQKECCGNILLSYNTHTEADPNDIKEIDQFLIKNK